jgi:hypothetical protein
MVSWVDHVIWWQVYPLGFLGAEKELGSVRGEVNRLPRVGGTVSLQTASACWAQCPMGRPLYEYRPSPASSLPPAGRTARCQLRGRRCRTRAGPGS